MTLLDITPYLDRVERINVAIDMGRLTDRERNLSKLLRTILVTCLTAGRARSVFRLVPETNGFEAWRRVLVEYEPREGA
eukprot:3290863-Heterocapsa_arctica.AAC.1